jgi:hypothetical protein
MTLSPAGGGGEKGAIIGVFHKKNIIKSSSL